MKTVLATIREQQNKTQTELAQRAQISTRYLQYLESGQKQPTAPVLFRLAKALNVKAEDLFIP